MNTRYFDHTTVFGPAMDAFRVALVPQPIPAPPPDEDVEDTDNDDAGDEPVEEGEPHA